MAKERIKKTFSCLLIAFLLVSEAKGAINPGGTIVSNAIGYLGRPYVKGAPFNKEAEYDDGNNKWGGIFSPQGAYTGGFDCSGLVSWCAGLRRHFFTWELYKLTDSIKWENLQPDDRLLGSGHTLIFEKWVSKIGTKTDKWKVGVIHASHSKKRVRRDRVRRDTFTVAGCKKKKWLPVASRMRANLQR
jgi:hypothetical protein